MAQSVQDLRFSVDSRLLEELGEELVTRNHVALSELIKNAYDADATEVTVKFIDASKEEGSGEIHVIDNGSGMTFEEVRKFWMRIATPEKMRNPVSEKYGRTKTGNKGIGRFACRRLANKLKLESIGELDSGELERTEVTFDWEEFERGEDLDEVPNEARTETVEDGPPGLTLKLIDLRDKWSQRDFDTLRRNVIMLSVSEQTRREGFDEDPGFDIHLDAPEFDMGEGELIDQFMEAGWGTLNGEINEDGTVSLKLDAKKLGEKSYELPEKFPDLGSGTIRFEIAHIPLDRKEYYRDPKTLSKTRAREITREQGGVRVYQDGFRVYPYGGPGDDWLGIDRDLASRRGKPDDSLKSAAENLKVEFSRTMLNHPRNRNLVGRVFIQSDPDLPLQIKMDREGFVEKDGFESLRNVIRLSLQWLTLHYNHFLSVNEEEELMESYEELKEESGIEDEGGTPVDAALDVFENVSQKASEHIPEDEMGVSDEAVESASKVVRGAIEQKESEINFLMAAFSVNQLVFGFSHELRTLVSDLNTHANTIEELIEDIPEGERERFEKFAESLFRTKDRFDQQIELFGMFMESSRDAQRRKIRLSDTVEKIMESTEYVSSYYEIDVDSEVHPSIKTRPMLESELFSIIINLVTNSIKAVAASTSKGGNILIEGVKEDGKTILRVYDDGIGLSKGDQSEVFEPLVTDPEGKMYKRLRDSMPSELSEVLGSGSGLGLYIVRSIANNYDGSAGFVEAGDDWETCVEVRIP